MCPAFSLLLLAACLPSARLFERKALDDYVAQVDPHYNYTLLKTVNLPLLGLTVYSLNMTSQKWLDESEVDRPLWTHQMFIFLPKGSTMKDSCFLFIDGGENDNVAPLGLGGFTYAYLAVSIRSCLVLLKQIPNQPITFRKIPLPECKNSTENNAVGCSWWMFLNNNSAPPHSLIEFPMTKAVVRAMDTITDFLLKASDTKINITKFALAGASKRGFPAWLGAAVDARVRSFIPIVSDFLNLVKLLHREYRSLCGWSYGLDFLHNMKITQQLDNPRFKEMASHIDPLQYNARYSNKPKFIIKASGDEVFQLDNPDLYWKQLKGEKRLLILPNAGHSLSNLEVYLSGSVKAFYVATMQNLTVPQVSWNRTETNTSGIIYFFTDQNPLLITCYDASSSTFSKRRDFRYYLATGKLSSVTWRPCHVQKVRTGVYKAEVEKPPEGWRGFFVSATYLGPELNAYVFTTEVHIIPNTYPCKDCKGEQCYGVVV